jgi:hypothetical protein
MKGRTFVRIGGVIGQIACARLAQSRISTAGDEPFGRELRAERLSRVEADPTFCKCIAK